jgi:hypothetical protein
LSPEKISVQEGGGGKTPNIKNAASTALKPETVNLLSEISKSLIRDINSIPPESYLKPYSVYRMIIQPLKTQ